MHARPFTPRFPRSIRIRCLLLVLLLILAGCGGPAAPAEQPAASQAPSSVSESPAASQAPSSAPESPTVEIATAAPSAEASTATPAQPATATAASSGGGQIAYVKESQIWLLDVATGETRQITSDGENSYPAWSPDGQTLAFMRVFDGNAEIATMRADGSELTRITNNPNTDLLPAYDRDGTLFFARHGQTEETEIEIVRRDEAGTETVVHTQPGGLCFPVRLSVASATQIALSINCGRGYNAFVIDPSTNKTIDISLDYAPTACVYQAVWARTQPLLTVITAENCSPQANTGIATLNFGDAQPTIEQVFANREIFGIDWSPDDQALVFQKESRNDPDLSGLWLLPLNGESSEPRQLIKEGTSPAWKPGS